LDVCVGDLDVYKIQMENCSLDAGFPFLWKKNIFQSCIAKWLTACNNTRPLRRVQLQWDVVAHDVV
jgi:hypothetical protein